MNLNFENVNSAAMVLRALRNKLRKRMLDLIEQKPGISVTNLFIELKLEQPVASQHLAILRHAGIVRTERDGKSIHYYIDEKNIEKISPLADQLAVLYKS